MNGMRLISGFLTSHFCLRMLYHYFIGRKKPDNDYHYIFTGHLIRMSHIDLLIVASIVAIATLGLLFYHCIYKRRRCCYEKQKQSKNKITSDENNIEQNQSMLQEEESNKTDNQLCDVT